MRVGVWGGALRGKQMVLNEENMNKDLVDRVMTGFSTILDRQGSERDVLH